MSINIDSIRITKTIAQYFKSEHVIFKKIYFFLVLLIIYKKYEKMIFKNCEVLLKKIIDQKVSLCRINYCEVFRVNVGLTIGFLSRVNVIFLTRFY